MTSGRGTFQRPRSLKLIRIYLILYTNLTVVSEGRGVDDKIGRPCVRIEPYLTGSKSNTNSSWAELQLHLFGDITMVF